MEDNITDIEAQTAFDSRVKQMGKGSCANGHKPIPRINQDNKWICPECDAPKSMGSGLINTLQDPGHEAMMSGNLPKIKEPINIMPRVIVDIPQPNRKYELDKIFKLVDSLPMPGTIKAVKKLIKIKQLLNELIEEN